MKPLTSAIIVAATIALFSGVGTWVGSELLADARAEGVALGLCREACAISDDDQLGELDAAGTCWCADGNPAAIKTTVVPTFTKIHAGTSTSATCLDSGRTSLRIFHHHPRNP